MFTSLHANGTCPFCVSSVQLLELQRSHSGIGRALNLTFLAFICAITCYGVLLTYTLLLQGLWWIGFNASLLAIVLTCVAWALIAPDLLAPFNPFRWQYCVFRDRDGRIHLECVHPGSLAEMSGRKADLRPDRTVVLLRLGIGAWNGRVYADGKKTGDQRQIRLDSVQPLMFSYRTPTIRLLGLDAEALLLRVTQPLAASELELNAEGTRTDSAQAPGR